MAKTTSPRPWALVTTEERINGPRVSIRRFATAEAATRAFVLISKGANTARYHREVMPTDKAEAYKADVEAEMGMGRFA